MVQGDSANNDQVLERPPCIHEQVASEDMHAQGFRAQQAGNATLPHARATHLLEQVADILWDTCGSLCEDAEHKHRHSEQNDTASKMEEVLERPPPAVVEPAHTCRMGFEAAADGQDLASREKHEVHPKTADLATRVVEPRLHAVDENHRELGNRPEDARLDGPHAEPRLDGLPGLLVLRARVAAPRHHAVLGRHQRWPVVVVEPSQRPDAAGDQVPRAQNVQHVQYRNEGEHDVGCGHRGDHRRDGDPHGQGMYGGEGVGLLAAVRHVQCARQGEAHEDVGDHEELQAQDDVAADAQRPIKSPLAI
mmetsp:Transcript_108052/g.302666  ORF Transcript_108052/g.302666 Transcript_108052/m.302666 type:complete len:307 (+) Transcript_108052:244-1164(+)